jgi:integrase
VYVLARYSGETEKGQLWLTDEGTDLSYWGGESIMRRLNARMQKLYPPKEDGTLRFPHLTYHLLRHTYAHWAIAHGAHPGQVQGILGHTSLAMTNHYMGDERQRRAAKDMPGFSPI